MSKPINPWCPVCSAPLRRPETVPATETTPERTVYPCAGRNGPHYSNLDKHQCLAYDHDLTEACRKAVAEQAAAPAPAQEAAAPEPDKPAKPAKVVKAEAPVLADPAEPV